MICAVMFSINCASSFIFIKKELRFCYILDFLENSNLDFSVFKGGSIQKYNSGIMFRHKRESVVRC